MGRRSLRARTERICWKEVEEIFYRAGYMRTVAMLRNRFRRMTVERKPRKPGKAMQTCRICASGGGNYVPRSLGGRGGPPKGARSAA